MNKDRNPPGATHYRQNPDGTRRHFIARDDHHFIWLGEKWGGWSKKVPYKHIKHDELIKVHSQ